MVIAACVASVTGPRGRVCCAMVAPRSQSIPERPAAQREATPPTGHHGGPFGGANFQFTAGVGLFPSLFGLQFVRTRAVRNCGVAATFAALSGLPYPSVRLVVCMQNTMGAPGVPLTPEETVRQWRETFRKGGWADLVLRCPSCRLTDVLPGPCTQASQTTSKTLMFIGFFILIMLLF